MTLTPSHPLDHINPFAELRVTDTQLTYEITEMTARAEAQMGTAAFEQWVAEEYPRLFHQAFDRIWWLLNNLLLEFTDDQPRDNLS